MRTLRLFVVGLAFAAVAAMSGWSAAQAQPSGVVLAVVQSAQVDSTTGKRTLQTEAPVYSGDRIVTGAIGEAQVRFRDNTKLVVGPNSTLVIDAFVFSDNNTARQISINAVRGAFRFITGNSRKDAYSITTPTATIGVRGTEFDVNVASDGQTSVAQYEGKTIICTRRPDDPAAAAQWRKRCVEVSDNCGVSIVSPNARDIQRIRGREERDFNLASFRYVRSQASLRREFRVDISGACGPIIFAALFNNPSNETLPEPPPPPTPPPPTDHPTEYTCEPKHHYFPKWPVHHPKDGEEEGYHPPRGPWHPKGDGEEEARLPFKKHFGDAPEGRSGYASWTKPGESEKFGDRGGEHRTLAFGIGGPEKSGRPDGEHRFGGDKPGFGDKPSGFTGLFTPPGNTRGVGGFEGGGGGFPGWHKPSGERTVAGFGEKPGPSGVGGFEKPKTFGGWSDKPASGPCTCQHTGEEGGGGGGGARTAGTTWGKPPVTTTAFTGGDDKGDKSFRGPGNTWGKPPVVASFGTEEDDKDGKGPGKGSRGPGNTWGKPPVVASFGAPPEDKEVDKTVSAPEEAPAVVAAVTEEDKPVSDKPGPDKPGSDKPVAFGFDKGNGDQDKGFGFGSKSGPSSFDKGPGDSKSPVTKPSDKSADKGSFGDKPSGKATKPSVSKPPVEKTAPPVEETVTPPVVETLAVVETPPAAETAEAPATVAEPPAEAPAAAAAEAPAEAPAAEAPAAEAPAAEAPAAEAPAAEAPAAEAPAAEAPAAEAPAAEAPAAEAPASAPAEAPAASSSESAPAQSSGGSSESSSSQLSGGGSSESSSQSSGGGSSESSSSSSGGGDSSSSSSSASESAPAPAPEASAPPAEAAPAEAAPAG